MVLYHTIGFDNGGWQLRVYMYVHSVSQVFMCILSLNVFEVVTDGIPHELLTAFPNDLISWICYTTPLYTNFCLCYVLYLLFAFPSIQCFCNHRDHNSRSYQTAMALSKKHL